MWPMGSRDAVLSVQMSEVIKDVADLKGELDKFRVAHNTQHDTERRDRIITRRWIIATLVAAITVIEPPLLILLSRGH